MNEIKSLGVTHRLWALDGFAVYLCWVEQAMYHRWAVACDKERAHLLPQWLEMLYV